MLASHRPLLLLLNGVFYTLDPARPRASAAVVDRTSGRIVAIGEASDLHDLRGPLTDTLDLRGRTVLPGFIDAHTHLLGYAQSALDVDLTAARSEAEAVEQVRQSAQRVPPGQWVRGRHWDVSRWAGAPFPTRASLDAVLPDHPVALWHYDFHALWVNSAALRRADITADTPDPLSGSIARDARGEPTGMLFEAGAMRLVESSYAPPDPATDLALLREALASLCRRGITGIHNFEDRYSFGLLHEVWASGGLAPRVLMYLPKQALPALAEIGLRMPFGDDHLRLAGIKIFADGALSSQTAAMFEPFEGQTDNRGLLTTSAEEIEWLARSAAAAQLGVAIHAIGDRAVHVALDALDAAATPRSAADAAAAERSIPAPRSRLEHVQLATDEDIARMARLGVVASVQPFHAVADRDKADRYWGARAHRSYAYRTLLDAGVPLALGSDAPVDICDPWRIVYAATTRRNDHEPERPAWHPEETLTLSQALAAYTQGAAYAGGQERHQGSLAPGKLADFAVLSEDPFSIGTVRLPQVEVVATLVGGELVYGSLD